MGKVLDLKSKLQTKKNTNHSNALKGLKLDPNHEFEPIVDIAEIREEMINQDRRTIKRTILTEFIGAFTIVPDRGLMKVSLYDISENGIAFDMDLTTGRFQVGEEVAMRVYLNHSTYFPFTVTISNSRVLEDEGIVRHGANFMKGTINNEALHHFVKFIETVSASLKKDEGDVLVSNIK